MSTIGGFFGNIVSIASPFILGLCIAFILNVPMRVIEKKLFKIKNTKLRRLVSLLMTVIIVLSVFMIVMFILIPELVQTIQTLIDRLPGFVNSVTALGKQISSGLPNIGTWLSSLDLNWDSIGKTVFNFLRNGATNILNSTVSIASLIFGGIYNFLIGIVFAIYILFQKENVARQLKKLIYAYLPEKRADRMVSIFAIVNKTFSKFITGQCTEAIILGLMFLVFMNIFQFPYALVISVLISCTALIPMFGAFIACFIGAFLILVTDPIQAVWFIVMFLVLQQIEGNVIYPRVVGNSLGLPGLWVLVAVLVGGSTMGVTGMLISVPLCSVLYVLLKESVGKRLAEKHVPKEKTL
jgi:predicted PurR-regulated permease PerM